MAWRYDEVADAVHRKQRNGGGGGGMAGGGAHNQRRAHLFDLDAKFIISTRAIQKQLSCVFFFFII